MLLHRIKTEALDVDIEQVLGYGCWCNFQTNVRGKGAPLDDFDKICHKWAQEKVDDILNFELIAQGQKFFEILISST